MALSSDLIKKMKESAQTLNNNGASKTTTGTTNKGYTAPTLGSTYNANTDYQAIINNAVANNDYTTAAKAEQLRNQKINATGSNYNTTNMYTGYLNPDYGTIGQQQMANGASWQDVLDTYNSRNYKASTTAGLEKYVNDDIQQAMWNYITNAQKQENQQGTQDQFNQWNQDYNQNNPKEEYTNPYKAEIDAILNEILNRDDFSYNAMNDPLYQQYAEMYRREGDRAMKETMAEAAAGAGGMNTYAMTAAMQANNYYNSQLNDKIPELYQLAYDMYLNDKESKVQDLGILQNMDSTQYSRYRDTINDWYNDKNFAYGSYLDAIQQGNWQNTFDYNSMVDNRNWNNDQYWTNKEWNYNDEWKNKEYTDNRSDIEYERNQAEEDKAKALIDWYIQNGVTTIDPETIAKAGLTQAAVNEMIAYKKQQDALKVKSSSGGKGNEGNDSGGNGGNGNGGKYDNGSLSTEQVKKLQTKLGITADGLWGSDSKDAAGGLSADDAWEKYFGDEGKGNLPYPTGDERWDASGNYQAVDEACKGLVMSKGKEEALAYLKRTLEEGAIDIYSYMTLRNKYRG